MGVRSKTWCRRVFVVLAAMLLVYGSARLYYRLTDDFRLGNITYDMPFQASWEVAPLSFEEEQRLNQILSQEYTYLGKGAQSYVFASEDHKYVIKFFKFKHLRPFWLVEMLPSVFPFRDVKERHYANKDRKLMGVFDGYKTAYDLHTDASAIVYMQLNAENNPKHLVNVKDKIGFKKTIDLQNVPFVVQEKGSTLRVVLKDLLDEGQLDIAKERVGQIIDLYLSEYQKGIYDRDHGVMHNTGFIGDRPIHLDVGKLTVKPSMTNQEVYKPDLDFVMRKLNLWFTNNYPQYKPQIKSVIEDKISIHFGEKYVIDESIVPSKKNRPNQNEVYKRRDQERPL